MGRHFRDELAAEGLNFQDALPVLRSGTIFNPPEIDIATREWKYRIEGYEESGKWLAIVFCFKAVGSAFLITIFSSIESRARKGE